MPQTPDPVDEQRLESARRLEQIVKDEGAAEERERIGVQLVERLRELDNLCAMSGNATWAQDTARRAEVRRVLVWLEATDAD